MKGGKRKERPKEREIWRHKKISTEREGETLGCIVWGRQKNICSGATGN